MDKFFTTAQDVPKLSTPELERMTEVALSYRQLQPEVRKPVFNWGKWWAPAFAAMACIVIMIGVMQPSAELPANEPASASVAQADDAYSDITEIAILDTLDSF